MKNGKTEKSLALWAFWIGIFVVIATHIYMLIYGMPTSQIVAHSIANLVAGGLILFGWSKK